MEVMLGEMDVHDIHVGELARRAGVAIPTIYYSFHSLDDIVAEATVVKLHHFLAPFTQCLDDMQRALGLDDREGFARAADDFMRLCWSPESNESIHHLSPLIAYFREIAPQDVRLRTLQAREVAGLIAVLGGAQAKGWIDLGDDVNAFVVVHWTCVLGQAIFWHPSFGALTGIDFASGAGRLRYQTTLKSDIRQMSVDNPDTTP
jgi:AcrR family transcriptional regulator